MYIIRKHGEARMSLRRYFRAPLFSISYGKPAAGPEARITTPQASDFPCDNAGTVPGARVAIRQIVSQAVISDQVIDIFAAAGLKSPDISILSDDFLDEVRELPQRHLAVELLQKLINDEIKTRLSRNVVQGRSFAAMLEESIRRYQNRSIEAAQVISELIELAKQLREAQNLGRPYDCSLLSVTYFTYTLLNFPKSNARIFIAGSFRKN